jgi:magnesium-protoporphyrin O-methyltransferase
METLFNDRVARRELRKYNKRGATGMTVKLIHAIKSESIVSLSLMDIGGGIGAIQHELVEAGAGNIISVDVAPAYLEASRQIADQLNYLDRVEYHQGDFVELAADLPASDIVTLDKVVCCYPDMEALVSKSAQLTRRYYGLVLPNENWLVGIVQQITNLVTRIRRVPFKMYLHSHDQISSLLNKIGFEEISTKRDIFWQANLYRRR